ncbi:hypothetical protein TcG_12025 [Trypanosoma cruzi]|nr:hypothetical protein TcG_12025 [Trypanosoma cruzi]
MYPIRIERSTCHVRGTNRMNKYKYMRSKQRGFGGPTASPFTHTSFPSYFIPLGYLRIRQAAQPNNPVRFLFACVPHAQFDSSDSGASTQSNSSVAAFAAPMSFGQPKDTHTDGRNKRNGAHPSPRRIPSLLSAPTEYHCASQQVVVGGAHTHK